VLEEVLEFGFGFDLEALEPLEERLLELVEFGFLLGIDLLSNEVNNKFHSTNDTM